MATVAERVGRGPCPNCGEPVTFKRSAGKLLNFKCDACASSGYSEPGGDCHEKWARAIKPFAPAAPAGNTEPDPPASAPAPKAKPKPANSAFSLGAL